MPPQGHACPVCDSPAPLFDVVDFNKNCEEGKGLDLPLSGEPVYYCLCRTCGFLFAPEFLDWTHDQFIERIYNADYFQVDPEFETVRPRQTAQMLEQMFGATKHEFTHLDFGGGQGALSRILNEQGWRSTSYDPFMNPDETLGGRTFDLITAFEVFEHAPHPHKLMEQILAAAHDETFFVVSTFVHDQAIRLGERITWWYVAPRNGHVSIFSKHSLERLGHMHGLKYGGFTDWLHCFCRTVPAWARGVVAG